MEMCMITKKKGRACDHFSPHTQYSKILKLKAERLHDGRGRKRKGRLVLDGWKQRREKRACDSE